jgi:D-alanine-D-alanine ligase
LVNVAILAGGPSSEHEVSLSTSSEMLSVLRAGGHAVRPVLIAHDNRWAVGGREDDFDIDERGGSRELALESLRTQGEIACLGLHGPFGEDGTVQRLLEDAGIPYTGSGHIASTLGMDKELSKLAAAKLGARTASHEVLVGSQIPVHAIQRGIGYPCFVKPVTAGSSVGVARVETEEALRAAVPAAQAEDAGGRCMVEALVTGSEVTCAVLRVDEQLVTFPLVAIEPSEIFYDYHAKYSSNETRYTCPADVPETTAAEIEALSRALYEGLELRGVARLDFIVQEDGKLPIFLEVNTLPGFTTHSLVPMAARAAGWTSLQVLEAVLADAEPVP